MPDKKTETEKPEPKTKVESEPGITRVVIPPGVEDPDAGPTTHGNCPRCDKPINDGDPVSGWDRPPMRHAKCERRENMVIGAPRFAYAGFFQMTDARVAVPEGGFGSDYAYPWAIQFAAPGRRTLDMGSGNGFSDGLAEVCGEVESVAAESSMEDTGLTPGFDRVFSILPAVPPTAIVLDEARELMADTGLMFVAFEMAMGAGDGAKSVGAFNCIIPSAGLRYNVNPPELAVNAPIRGEDKKTGIFHAVLRRR